MKHPLWEHQREAAAYAAKQTALYDASDPGTGKTRTHLEVFFKRRKANGGRALIVAPLTLMEPAWGGDIEKYFPDLTISYAYAGKDKFGRPLRRVAFEQDTDIVAINTDGVKWIADQRDRATLLREFDTLIIDEIIYYKHRTSARSKAIKKIAPLFKYKVGMCGTPYDKSVTELWHQFLILDDGMHFGTSFSRFRGQLCTPKHNGFGIEWEDRPNANELAMHIAHNMMLRYKFDEVMDVPPNYTRSVKIKLTPNLFESYEELENAAYIEFQAGKLSAVNKAVEVNKLLQICSGATYLDDGSYVMLDPSRYELIMQLVAEREQTVVFFNWQHQRIEMVRLAEKRGIPYEFLDGTVPNKKRAAIVSSFQGGDYQVLFLQAKTGAHGLTLTKGRTTIWSSPRYEPSVIKQGLHRIYRGGQTKTTETIMIVASDTIEEQVYSQMYARDAKMVDWLELIEQAQRGRKSDIS